MTLSQFSRRRLAIAMNSQKLAKEVCDILDAGEATSISQGASRRLAAAVGEGAANVIGSAIADGESIPQWAQSKLAIACASQIAAEEIFAAINAISAWTPGVLSVNNSTATEGDSITFSYDGTGASSFQLYKDGRYVLGGTSMPYVLFNIGVQDAGDYTLYAEGPGGSTTTSAVTVSVAANNIVTDNFTGSVSGEWTSTTGTPDLTSNRFNCNAALGSALYVQKTISNDNVRFQFTLNADSLSSGTANCFELGAANPICGGLLIYSAGIIYLRITTNVNGPYWPSDDNVNYSQSSGYYQFPISGSTKVEIRWYKYLDGATATGDWHVYINDQLTCAVVGTGNNGVYYPSAATYLRIGKTNGSADGAGTFYIDSVQVKHGNVAFNAFTAASKIAGVWMGGQSNAAGADNGSYSAITDSIGSKGIFSLNTNQVPTTSPNQLFVMREIATTSPSPSANIAYTFLQNIDLPAGYEAYANMNGIGSTGFNTNPGWGTTYPLYRDRAKTALSFAQRVFESYTNIALLWHQGEGDAGNDNYQTYLSDLIGELRAITGENTPFIAGGLSPEYLTGGSLYGANYQETTDDIEALMGTIANGGFASSVSPSSATVMASQKIHFDGAGYRTMGQRYASAYLAIVPEATP